MFTVVFRRLFSVAKTVKANPLVIYSKTYCGYCDRAKAMLATYNPSVVEVDLSPDADAITRELMEMTGQRTFPNVFVKGEHIGGSSDVADGLSDGTIQDKLS
jgi:glutaredoxin